MLSRHLYKGRKKEEPKAHETQRNKRHARHPDSLRPGESSPVKSTSIRSFCSRSIPMPPAYLFAGALSSLLIIHARRKKSLSTDGQAAAFVLGMATFSSRFAYFTVILLVFFLASSKLTKVWGINSDVFVRKKRKQGLRSCCISLKQNVNDCWKQISTSRVSARWFKSYAMV